MSAIFGPGGEDMVICACGRTVYEIRQIHQGVLVSKPVHRLILCQHDKMARTVPLVLVLQMGDVLWEMNTLFEAAGSR